MKIARVFPRRTSMTPADELAFVDCPPPLLAMPEVDEVHVSVAFTWDMQKAERLAEEWRAVGVPVKMGGPAFNLPGGEFVPGLYVKRGGDNYKPRMPESLLVLRSPQTGKRSA